MEHLHNGQCGLCTHFGENHIRLVLVTILSSQKPDEHAG